MLCFASTIKSIFCAMLSHLVVYKVCALCHCTSSLLFKIIQCTGSSAILTFLNNEDPSRIVEL